MSKQSFRKDTSWCKLCVALFVIFGFSSVTGFKVQHMCVKLHYKLGKYNTETKALHLASNEETMSTTQQIWVCFQALKQNYSCWRYWIFRPFLMTMKKGCTRDSTKWTNYKSIFLHRFLLFSGYFQICGENVLTNCTLDMGIC